MYHFRIRIETWDRRGNNLGWQTLMASLPNVEAAIDKARDIYREVFPQETDKQLSIFTDKGMVWKYHKGKTQTFTPQ